MSGSRGEDRRVRRTKGQLRGAIASLIHEKAYDAIAVKEILALTSRCSLSRKWA